MALFFFLFMIRLNEIAGLFAGPMRELRKNVTEEYDGQNQQYDDEYHPEINPVHTRPPTAWKPVAAHPMVPIKLASK